MRKSLSAGAAALLLGLANWSGAQAQSASTAPSSNSGGLEEVVVTAERRTEDVQKTPMNVTVIAGEDVQRVGLSNMENILADLPGVTIQGQVRGFDPTIRGLGTDLPPGSAQGAVAVEEDGIYDIRAESGVVGYYDMQRLEVLAGPQGTLYGVNSDGGVVNIISNNPTLGKFAASGALTTGTYNLLRGEAAINLPVSDNSAIRFAAASINQDGYLDTGAGDSIGQGGRIKYLWKPDDNFSLLLGYELQKLGGKGQGSVENWLNGDCHTPYDPYTGNFIHVANCWSDATGPAYGIAVGSYGPTNPPGCVPSGPPGTTNVNGCAVESDAKQQQDYHSNKYWAELKWNLGFANLAFTPAYKYDAETGISCGMGLCSFGGDPAKLQQNSEELKLTQANGSKIQWTAGLYHWGYLQSTFGAGPAGSVYQTSNAVFGEVTLPLSDQFRVKLGARDSQDWKHAEGGGPIPAPLTFSHFDYRAGAEYDVAAQSMLYATVSTGYRPGGYNLGAGTFKTEQVTDIEVGAKNRFWDNRLQVNVDAYYYDFQNYQLLDFYTPATQFCNNALNGGFPAFPPTLNLSAKNVGADLAIAWAATDNDRVNVSASYEHNQFTSSATIFYNPINSCQSYLQGTDPNETASVGSVVLSNAVEPHSPTLSGNVSWEHTFPLASGAGFTLRPSMHYSSGYYVHPEESAGSYQPTYETYDVTLGYNSVDNKWSANVWGRNLGDYAVKTAFIPPTLGEPRTVGLTVSAHF